MAVSLYGYKMLILMITNHMFWINKEVYIMFLKQENDFMKLVVFKFMV